MTIEKNKKIINENIYMEKENKNKEVKEVKGVTETPEVTETQEITDVPKLKILTDFLLDLKVLSKLEVNQKLVIRNNQLNIDSTYFQSVNRYISNDSRENTLNYIEELNNNLSNEIENILDNYSKNKNIQDSPSNILINISQNLKLACKGLINLTTTYLNDQFNKSKIEIIIEQFQLKITKISEYIEIKK